MADLPQRPCLALPFTILPVAAGVHLVAGEDWRYLLSGATLANWLPTWLARLDGASSREQLLADLPAELREQAQTILRQLHGERLLREGPIEQAHTAGPATFEVIGTGPLADLARARLNAQELSHNQTSVAVLVQNTLDYRSALAENERLRRQGRRWFWLSSGAMTRGYVGPLFLPDAGPCLSCLVRHFRRLSPAPHLYDLLHESSDIRPSPLSLEASALLVELLVLKRALLTETQARPALYRLHVLEADSLEVTSHAVPRDPECPTCGSGA